MRLLKEKEIQNAIINIYDYSKNIYKLCSENITDVGVANEIDGLYSNRAIPIRVLELMSNNIEEKIILDAYLKKYSKEIEKIADLDRKIIAILGIRKSEMAQELRDIQNKKNVLIYK